MTILHYNHYYQFIGSMTYCPNNTIIAIYIDSTTIHIRVYREFDVSVNSSRPKDAIFY